MPAFVALLARDLEVSVLIDGGREGKDAQRLLSQAAKGLITEQEICFLAEADGLPPKADIEDVFSPTDYLRLFNWAFNKRLSPADIQSIGQRIVPQLEQHDGVYDHVLPAYELTRRLDEFFATVEPDTLSKFEKLIARLNSTIPLV